MSAERRHVPFRIAVVAALGLGAGSLGTLALQRSFQESQHTETQAQFAKLLSVNVGEARSISEFSEVFDTVFSHLENGGLSVRLPDHPRSLTSNTIEVVFQNGGMVDRSLVTEYKLIKDRLGHSILRRLQVTTRDFDTIHTKDYYQWYDNQPSSPNTMDMQEQGWRQLTRSFTEEFNTFVEEYNKDVDQRADYDLHPEKRKG
ncbi:MAG: hypothetical protein Q8P92_00615 [Candidatus Daviesbacteria bacterium]|nr:hypothetical protein [Candidatus Daviesbacteria bacterium]